MYKLLFLSGLISVLSLGDVRAMDRGERELNVLSTSAKQSLVTFLNPNFLRREKECLGLVTPFDSDFCDEMTQRIHNNDIETTKRVIAERFLFFVSGITSICSMNLASFLIARELARYRDILLYGHEFTEELFNHYMQNETIKSQYALFS